MSVEYVARTSLGDSVGPVLGPTATLKSLMDIFRVENRCLKGAILSATVIRIEDGRDKRIGIINTDTGEFVELPH